MEGKIKLSVLGFSFNQTQSGIYDLVMAEEDGLRRLLIVIGTPEAQSIAFRLQGSSPPRPLTHDLFQSLTSKFGILLREVLIYKYENGVFYSRMYLSQGIYNVEIECRTSDAIAIAIRTQSPIYTTEEILQDQGFIFDERVPTEKENEVKKNSKDLDFALLDLEELESLLKDAVEGEDYERASLIRDELKKKQKKDL